MDNSLNSNNFIDGGQPLENLLTKEQEERKSNRSFTIWVAVMLAIVSVIVVLNSFVFIYADVVGTSMVPTLQSGDKLVANRYKDFTVGSIVVIDGVEGEDNLIIKRVIALEGDVVEIKDNRVYVNGKALNEPYAYGKTEQKGWYNWTTQSQYTLKEGEVFYLGDNRVISKDARATGPCKEEQIVAVVTDWSLWLNDLFK